MTPPKSLRATTSRTLALSKRRRSGLMSDENEQEENDENTRLDEELEGDSF